MLEEGIELIDAHISVFIGIFGYKVFETVKLLDLLQVLRVKTLRICSRVCDEFILIKVVINETPYLSHNVHFLLQVFVQIDEVNHV